MDEAAGADRNAPAATLTCQPPPAIEMARASRLCSIHPGLCAWCTCHHRL